MDRRMLSSSFVVIGLCLLLAPAARAADETITFFESAFLPTAVSIDTGDTVTWEWFAGTHQLVSGASSNPADNPGQLFDEPIDFDNQSFSYTFSAPGVYSFFDGENENGLVGTILVEPTTVVVGIVDNSFTPQNVDIFQGDRVRWEWIEGVHTITSGASSNPVDNPGALFNEVSTMALTVFEYDFLDAGLQPYFCIPHEPMGMTGSVMVQRLFVRGDTTLDGTVALSDGIAILSYLFNQGLVPSCLDAADVNDDGSVALNDAILVLTYLFGGTVPSLPAPFPAAGADRTADGVAL